MSNPYRPALTEYQRACVVSGRAATLRMLTRTDGAFVQPGLEVVCGGDAAVEWDEHGALDRYAVRHARSGTLNSAAWERVAAAGGGLHWTGAGAFHMFVPHAHYRRAWLPPMRVDAHCVATVATLLLAAAALVWL